MDWKREAENRLREYKDLKSSLRRTELELTRLENDAKRRAENWCAEEDSALNVEIARAELEAARRDTLQWLAVTEDALRSMTEAELLILDAFFLHRKRGAAEYLCDAFHVVRSVVYRKRDDALKRFTTLLYGVAGQ